MSNYQNRNLKASRPAHAGDPDYDASKEQVVVTFDDDNTQKTVLKSEVKN